MFNLIPWKKRSGNTAVRLDSPVGELGRGYEDDFFPLTRLHEEFDSLMNRFFEDRGFGSRLGNLPSLWNEPQFDENWDFGWEDLDKEYVFQAELPSFEPEDFEVKVCGNVLTVRAEHKDEEENGGSHYRYGSFSRRVTLPHGVDAESIDARYHSGVLEVHLPKTEQAMGKRIEVTSA